MALNTVLLKWDLSDLIESGLSATLTITPTAQLADTTDHILIPAVARTVTFTGGLGQLAGIVANDNTNITPTGTGYLITVVAQNGQIIVAQFQTQILYANGATQWLDQLAIVPNVTTSYQYLPLPSGTPTSGQVPIATGSGENSAWGTPSSGGAVSSVFGRTGAVAADSGDYTVSQVTGAAPLASPALTGTPTAPTASGGTDTTQIATTAFVEAAVPSLPLSIADGGTGQTTAAAALAGLGGLGLVATTGLTGFTFQDATPNIISWTAPNDGNMHRVALFSSVTVTSAQTGGAISISLVDPGDVTRATRGVYAGGAGTGYISQPPNTPMLFLIYPGSAVTLYQSTAQTAGAAVLWAEMWAL
jgi:hypothetical protein